MQNCVDYTSFLYNKDLRSSGFKRSGSQSLFPNCTRFSSIIPYSNYPGGVYRINSWER